MNKKKYNLILCFFMCFIININATKQFFHHPDDISLTAIYSDKEIKIVRIEYVEYNKTFRVQEISTINFSDKKLDSNVLFAWHPQKKLFAISTTKKVFLYDKKTTKYVTLFNTQKKDDIKDIYWQDNDKLEIVIKTKNQNITFIYDIKATTITEQY